MIILWVIDDNNKFLYPVPSTKHRAKSQQAGRSTVITSAIKGRRENEKVDRKVRCPVDVQPGQPDTNRKKSVGVERRWRERCGFGGSGGRDGDQGLWESEVKRE